MASVISREVREGIVFLSCSQCGKMFPAFEEAANVAGWMDKCFEEDDYRLCKKCKDHPVSTEPVENLPQLGHDSGIPDNYMFHRDTGEFLSAPIIRTVAMKVWENRERNLLLSGATGLGKSTSACYVALKLLEQRQNIRYVKLRELLSEWREVKRSEVRFADKKFFARLRRLNVLIIDEIADKVKQTESGQELMYEILDQVYTGEMKTRVWILGNFRSGVLAEIFGDAEPVFRRVEERFVCLGIKPGKIEEFHVWKKGV